MSSYQNLTPDELQPMLGKENVRLIDVRTDAEVARGCIPGAIKLPLHLLPMRISELEQDCLTVFYCQMGGRSAQAAAFAIAQGFNNVFNLQGGITSWAHSGREIVV